MKTKDGVQVSNRRVGRREMIEPSNFIVGSKYDPTNPTTYSGTTRPPPPPQKNDIFVLENP